MSRSHRALRTGILVLAAAVLAPGVTEAVAHSGSGKESGGILRIGTPEDVAPLDPALAYYVPSWEIEYATCAKLFDYPDRPGAKGTEVVPEVVRRFTVSQDGRTYTFDLKRTFRFHTGAPVNASSFAAAFNRDADPGLHSFARDYMHEIAGADAVMAGEAGTISGVRVLGPHRLQIRLTRPLGDLPARLTMPFFCPVPPGTPRHAVDLPAGSGPYYVAEHVVERRLVLRRNPYYRGDRPAKVDAVEWTFGLRLDDCVAATERGEVDICRPPSTADVHRALAARYGINRPGGRYFVAPALETTFLVFNHERPAFRGAGQIPLAKAINYAIDRRALTARGGYLSGRRGDRILPPALGREEHEYPIAGADAVTARRWLAKAKVRPKKLVLYAANDPVGVGTAEILAYDLRRLGIELEVKYFSGAVGWQKVRTRGEPFDLALAGWWADYADAAAFFRPLLDGRNLKETGNSNIVYLDDPNVNAAIDAADRLTGAARRKAFADLDARLMREAPPWAPVFRLNNRTFVSAGVGCFFTHPVYTLDLAALCKKELP